ncbi:MAG: hypothetical protein NC252_04810 [Roseburia sp.]|nr:hypothetical protein [Roseburia sp.]
MNKIFKARFSGQNLAFFQTISSKRLQAAFPYPEKQKLILSPKNNDFDGKNS